jgi:ABC-type uncharacterized transport system permease subunit
MSNLIELFIKPGLINGLCYGIAAIGISLPLRFLRTADFTAVGAIMVGSVVTIAATNACGIWSVGLCFGSIVAGLLGILTAFLSLNKRLNIPIMLAGIICFTAAQSIGLLITDGAAIELNDTIHFLSAKFAWPDAAIILAIAVTIGLGFGILARTKLGCLAFAMCANSQFVKFRHRYSKATTYWLLFISNFLVGLSGGLIVLKSRTAYSAINMEFLALTLGAIYAGHAVVRLVAGAVKHELPEGLASETRPEAQSYVKGHWENFRLSLSEDQRDESERLWFLFLSYILASIVLNNVAAVVRDQSLFNISPAFEHIVVATMITIGLFLSNSTQKRKVDTK